MMRENIQDPIGAQWLVNYYGIQVLQPLSVLSGIASRRVSQYDEGRRLEFYQERQRPESTPVAHLQFFLRHEIPHFEFLSRLFQKMGNQPIQQWVNQEPTGQYARRAAFLFEFFTGQELVRPMALGGTYVDAIDSDKVLSTSATAVEKVSKWRINNNLAGNRYFCPTFVKDNKTLETISVDVKALLRELNQEVGEDFLVRSAVWFTLGESRASFKIEGEGHQLTRIQRFADVMERFTGNLDIPLDLGMLQREILGDKTLIQQFGVRQSPVFVGKTRNFRDEVHYIAPSFDLLEKQLEGLYLFWNKTAGQSPVVRVAVMAFAFVYLHPLADGNGRLHRFLFNHLLRSLGETAAPIILPISGVIAESAEERLAYAKTLEILSKPLMRGLEGTYSFVAEETQYADGIYSNLVFDGEEIAKPVWFYMDLTQHVIYFARLLQKTIVVNMRQESLYLRNYDKAREALQEVIEMPGHYADRVIRSILDNQGILSQKLKKEMPLLEEEGVWQQLVDIVRTYLGEETQSH
ncbi:Fic family protein [Pelistega suis]|uniref:Fic family protein n=1 Tax=Pelistega suis TaxID=1631957 RepID=UPI00211C46FE|nr:Fic family protein [Pelistega suis]MCQ9328007.1 Fic family protein [Pelistega suis]